MTPTPDGKTRLLNLINLKNTQQLTMDQVVFSNPRVNTDPVPANTAVDAQPALQVMYYGWQTYYYNRQSLSDWAAANAPNGVVVSVNGITTIGELLVLLNNLYNAGFSTQDFADGPLPTGPYPQNIILAAQSTSYAFTGSLLVTLSTNVIPFGEAFPVTNLGDLDGTSVPASGGWASGSGNQFGGWGGDGDDCPSDWPYRTGYTDQQHPSF
ncbi:MAG TPA: hypothetical protein VN081_04985 [Dongiaceae bacterium]|nr:hypothetical protein [Dongiaceae bacterium]